MPGQCDFTSEPNFSTVNGSNPSFHEISGLTHITYPDSSVYEFEYTDDGLLTAKIEPNGNRYQHIFDETGRLTDAIDDEGGHWRYNREALSSGDIIKEVLTAEGNLTTYTDRTDSPGSYTSTITDPTGAQTLYRKSSDGLTVDKSLPCGTDLQFKYDLDPEYKFKFIKEMRETSPSGVERITQTEKSYQDTDSDGVPDLITDTVAVNSKTTTVQNDVLQSRKTIASPEGRTAIVDYNGETLLTKNISALGLYATEFEHDDRGRLTAIQRDMRGVQFTYDNSGNLESITDPQGFTTTYDYDMVGRVTALHRPDGGALYFTYDANGNMTILTNPSDVDHAFDFNAVNLKTTYQTPISGSYRYHYDADRRLTRIDFPSGRQLSNYYDATKLTQIQTPQGNIDFTYLCGSKIESISKGSETVTYGYDGKLVLSETLSGTLNASLQYSYNDDFAIDEFTYAGGTTRYNYDDDGLLVSAGDFSIALNVENGLPESVSDGTLDIERTFNGYGELDSQNVSVASNAAFQWTLTRDNSGRIISKTETAGGITSDYAYTYDTMGRLSTVTKNGTLAESYTYDLKGTRISETNALRGIANREISYSDEDHLLTARDVSYQYNPDGYLILKRDGTEVTDYNYSLRGELLQVWLPDGRIVSYDHDPLGRRIAKRVDGIVKEKYLWQGMTRLLAVYDRADNLIQRFEYADARVPVSMTYGGVKYYLAYDQVGSLCIVADSSGNVVKRIDYDSFGNILEDTNESFPVPFGFAGGLYDRDTGLVRFGYRDYDPDIGRWTAKDPIGFAGGDTNLYGYTFNDPVNLFDPLGLAWRQQRPLNIPGFQDTTAGPFHHDRILFDDGTESGYYSDSRVKDDPAPYRLKIRYENVGEYLKDDILRKAVDNVKPKWDYSRDSIVNEYDFLKHNCQDYVDAVLEEYYRLVENLENSNPCN